MIPEGKSADEILANPLVEHSSWHFFQAVSWADLAKRKRLASALHYAALEMRLGIEYLLFELFHVSNRNITEDEYRKCVGSPAEMKRMLESEAVQYSKRIRFTQVLQSLDPRSPKFRYWDLKELFKFWGIASELVHFVGTHSRTYRNDSWFLQALERIEGVLKPIWNACTTTQGVGILSMDNIEPEVQQAWDEFSRGDLNEEGLKTRMQLARPILEQRFQRRNAKA